MVAVALRIQRIRNGLTPAEWTRMAAMIAIITGLHVAGWVMLAAAVRGHYRISGTEAFGLGTGA